MWLAALVLLIGESLIFTGLWWIFPPAALIVLGVQLIPVSLLAGSRT